MSILITQIDQTRARAHRHNAGTNSTKSFTRSMAMIVAPFCVMVAFSVFMIYGVFFTHIMNEFGWSRSITASTPSIRWGMYSLFVIPMAWIAEKYNPKFTLTLGGLLIGVGLFFCSQINSIWHLNLFFGIVGGVGTSTIFVSCLITLMKSFAKKSGLILGTVLSGIPVGTLALSPLMEYVIDSIGWRMAFIVLSLSTSLVIVLAAAIIQSPSHVCTRSDTFQNNRDEHSGPSVKETIRTKVFLCVYLILVLVSFGSFGMQVHLVPYAINLGISSYFAASTLSVMAASSILGRIVMGTISDHIGRVTTLIICCVIQTISMILNPFVSSFWLLYTVSLIFGFSYGGWVSGYVPAIGKIFGHHHLILIYGISETAVGIGGIAGPLIFGYLFDTTGGYITAFMFAAIASFAAFVLGLIIKTRV